MLRKLNDQEICFLADLWVCRARVDPTEPDPQNPRVGWRSDQLLQDIDALVIYERNDPGAYARIAQWALSELDQADTPPEISALLQLAMFRGVRLMPMTPEWEKKVEETAGGLEEFIASLPTGNRKARCQSLLLYHVGVFRDTCGHFGAAADMQSQAGNRADFIGDKPGAAVCRFLEANYLLKKALVDGLNGEVIEVVFSVLEQAFYSLVEQTQGSAMEVSWGKGNGPCHMIQACVWLNRNDHPNWDTWVDTALAAAKKLGQAFAPGAEFVQAVDLEKRNEVRATDALLLVADDVGQANERRAAALLVLGRRRLINPRPELAAVGSAAATEYFADMPEPGAQHVIAAAKHELAEFERACKKEGT